MVICTIIFIVGVTLGAIMANIIRFEATSEGVLDVDHHKEVVTVRLTSNDFIDNRKKKKVILKVNHDARLSQK